MPKNTSRIAFYVNWIHREHLVGSLSDTYCAIDDIVASHIFGPSSRVFRDMTIYRNSLFDSRYSFTNSPLGLFNVDIS